MRLFYKIGSLALFALMLYGCRKPTSANWDVDVVLPLVNSHLSIQNFIGDSIFKADNTGLLNFSVTREITAIKLDSLLNLPDTSIVKTFTLPVIQPSKVPPGQNLPFFPPSELKFNIDNGVELKYMDIHSGKLTIKFSNNLTQPLDMLYLIPSATRNGVPLTISETIPPGVNSLVKAYDLTSYHFNMQGLSGLVYNTLTQTYTVTVNPQADTVRLSSGILTIASIEISYSKIVPQYVEGYFGQQTISVPLDTARLNLIDNFHATNFMLSDATLNFKILNEFGAEFTGSLSNIKAINSTANKVVSLTSTHLSNINIDRATRAGDVVFPTIKAVSLASTNSNIVPFLSNLPDKLSYQGSIQVNPLANIWDHTDFAYYAKGIRVLADINIPMRFSADNFKLKSKAAVDFANLEQLDNVRSGNFVIQSNNGYPFRAMLQAYLLDDKEQVIDSLFVPTRNIIAGGQLDNQNKVVAPAYSKVYVPIDQAKIEKMRKSKSIQIVTYFLMPPSPPDITFYENYRIDVNIVAELTYNVQRK